MWPPACSPKCLSHVAGTAGALIAVRIPVGHGAGHHVPVHREGSESTHDLSLGAMVVPVPGRGDGDVVTPGHGFGAERPPLVALTAQVPDGSEVLWPKAGIVDDVIRGRSPLVHSRHW